MTSSSHTVGGTAYTTNLRWNANGSLASLQISDQVGGTSDSQTCSYSHDDLGRIHSVNCGTGQPNLNLSFDPFGNLLSQSGSPAGLTTSFSYSNNRISGENYDSDGNLEDDPVIPARGVNAFDAEGHAVKFENASVVYDALGRALEVSGTWQFVYGPGGRKLAVMNGTTLARADIPLPGGDEAIFNASGLAYFRRGDWLGSSRLSSTPTGTVYAARAYTPYGAPYDESGGSGDRDFTGARQDIAPNKYDFLFREYEPVSGRWFTPDPAGLAAVDPNNPQSWNRYAYVGGNPLGAVDPLGLDRVCIDDGLGTIHCVDYGSPGAGGNGSGAGAGNGGCGGNGPGALAVFGGRYTAAADCGGGGGGSSSGPPDPPTKPRPKPGEIPTNPCQFMGTAMSPQQYADLGRAAMWNPFTAVSGLRGFSIRGFLDAQPFATGNVYQRAAYSNYVYGVWMRASGTPLWLAIEAANEVAWVHSLSNRSQFVGRTMDRLFWSLPAANVADITAGYNAEASGALCHP